jgi:TolB protein
VLMIRQTLDADSAYVDAALHGDGLTSLQSREEKGGATHEVGLNNASPKRLRLEKHGDYFYMFLAGEGEDLHLAGGSMRLKLAEPFYIGIGVCAHDKDAVERAVFSNVSLAIPKLYSTLETITVSSTDRRVVSVFPERIEAPNWTPDGNTLIFNSGGRMKRIPAAGGKVETIDTGTAIRCNNDHGISPDGKLLAISDQTQGGKSSVYILPIEGGTPKRITEKSPSYWHGWAPDGKRVAFCGERGGKFDVYTIPVEGGEETQLTKDAGHNDGPEYSPDGKYIYFNSDRTGTMQIWRMAPDGSGQEQVTSDDWSNWFPHISPDGAKMVYLTYDKDVTGHPANKDVMLRVMTLADKKVRIIAKLFGGQGTMNVPSWSPDSKRLAFVSYQQLP